jgi:hypothetical protein
MVIVEGVFWSFRTAAISEASPSPEDVSLEDPPQAVAMRAPASNNRIMRRILKLLARENLSPVWVIGVL